MAEDRHHEWNFQSWLDEQVAKDTETAQLDVLWGPDDALPYRQGDRVRIKSGDVLKGTVGRIIEVDRKRNQYRVRIVGGSYHDRVIHTRNRDMEMMA